MNKSFLPRQLSDAGPPRAASFRWTLTTLIGLLAGGTVIAFSHGHRLAHTVDTTRSRTRLLPKDSAFFPAPVDREPALAKRSPPTTPTQPTSKPPAVTMPSPVRPPGTKAATKPKLVKPPVTSSAEPSLPQAVRVEPAPNPDTPGPFDGIANDAGPITNQAGASDQGTDIGGRSPDIETLDTTSGVGKPNTKQPGLTNAAEDLTKPIRYDTCDDAYRAGAAPIPAGQPGYRPRLDADQDGIACDIDLRIGA